MSEIHRYVLVDTDDVEQDYEHDNYSEALKVATRLGHAIIRRTYVYEDEDLVWTPDGSSTWPPQDEEE